MRRQPVGRHVQHACRRQTRRHHPPADRALKAAKSAQKQQSPGPAGRDLAWSARKTEEPNRPDQADDTAQAGDDPIPTNR